ncbi:hypothetical protein BDE02_19G003700 [Populus trichocarpa]|nr:hypothetical protein BDE02_19G003700 [Populus trichocarpa]
MVPFERPPSPPPSIYMKPEERWETIVEWEHPDAKDVLLVISVLCLDTIRPKGSDTTCWSAKTIKELARTPQIQEADFMFGLYIIQVRGCPAILCDSKIIFLVESCYLGALKDLIIDL